jgi:proteasome lid subunit RPN8/RPN11
VKLLLPLEHQNLLIDSLQKAGVREIGGVLMGEHVATDTFRVKSLTIQYEGGAFASFVRFLEQIVRPLAAFFKRTNYEYRRFNYLGEWHSHPSFALVPSCTDIASMREIVDDPNVGATFAVLLIVKRSPHGRLEATLTVFPAGRSHYSGEITFEEQP